MRKKNIERIYNSKQEKGSRLLEPAIVVWLINQSIYFNWNTDWTKKAQICQTRYQLYPNSKYWNLNKLTNFFNHHLPAHVFKMSIYNQSSSHASHCSHWFQYILVSSSTPIASIMKITVHEMDDWFEHVGFASSFQLIESIKTGSWCHSSCWILELIQHPTGLLGKS